MKRRLFSQFCCVMITGINVSKITSRDAIGTCMRLRLYVKRTHVHHYVA